MYETTIPYVEGTGKQTTYNDTQPFNPKTFEQAIHGLQQLTLDLARYQNRSQRNPDALDEPYDVSHTRTTTDDGTPVLELEEDSALEDIVKLLIYRWDQSVLIDDIWDDSYAIRTSADCGGGYLVYATIYIREGDISTFTVGHTDINDPSKKVETSDLGPYESSRVLAHLNRSLERAVTEAYAKTISSAATAFDFLATKTDVPPTGSRAPNAKSHREKYFQKDWAEIRGKTEQTVSNNATSARKELFEIPEPNTFNISRPALEQTDRDADDADVRLT